MPEILHVTPRPDWDAAQAGGEYRGDSLMTEGFLHCCRPEQLAGVIDRYFRGRTGLAVLRIDVQRLQSPLRSECPPGSDELFPHVYGPLNLDAVTEVVPLEDLLSRKTGG